MAHDWEAYVGTARQPLKAKNHLARFIGEIVFLPKAPNYSVLNTINRLVEEGFYYSAGELRTTPVKIGGTTWEPELPIESEIKKDIDTITNKKKSHIDIAIELLLYVVRKQMFLDGNKRTSVIFANHYLISKGKGLIVIPVDLADYYKKLLIDYYETNNSKEITKFLKEQCYLNLKN